MKLHTAKTKLEEITGLTAFDVNHGMEISLTSDQASLVPQIAGKLVEAGVPFRKKPKGKKFAGATFFVPLKNVGNAYQTDWEFDCEGVK